MPGKKKKFIDKEDNAVTFYLVHRSQQDPLQADDEAPQRVLLPIDAKATSNRKEAQRQYGVFYDDDYNYLQHLKDTNEMCMVEPMERFKIEEKADTPEQQSILNLPSSVFGSNVETDVGLLNKAVLTRGPRPDWDPDIVAGLDDDFNYGDPDNLLQDDFIQHANVDGPDKQDRDSDMDYDSDKADFSGDEDMCPDSGDEYGDRKFMNEETKSHFTNYSMTSSVIHRSEGLTLLDDRFEKLYEQYEETEIGPLDHEDIEGHVQQDKLLLNNLLDEFEKTQIKVRFKDIVDEYEGSDVDLVSDDSDDSLVNLTIEKPTEKWDCESILSTYSTLYNHPKTIEEPRKDRPIKLSSKLQVPVDVFAQPGLTRKQIEADMRASQQADRASTLRPKDETTDEKKARKQAIKEERKDRRLEKKASKTIFKTEQLKQQKDLKNTITNIQGIKMS